MATKKPASTSLVDLGSSGEKGMSLLANGCVSGACHSILEAFGLPVGPEEWVTVTDKD